MAQYGIGLSALNAFSEAIDVTSNNIANGQTVGYKSAEYVFADQFFKAQNPQSRDRAGMGTSRMIIRRANTYGTISGTQNPLDLAIAGPGMFMLAKQVDGTVPTENPQKFQYTRNGQFAVDSENRIVNENGLFLVGYAADTTGKIIESTKSVLKLDDKPLPQQATKKSTIEVNLDSRASVITGGVFDPKNAASYSQTTSQTVYDDKGQSHTLSMYYKKVNSADLILTQDRTANTFQFQPKQTIGTILNGEQGSSIATTAAPGSVTGLVQTLNNTLLTYISGGSENITGLKTVSIGAVGSGYVPGIYKNVPLTSGGSGTGALATVTIAQDGTLGAIEITNTGSGYVATDTLSINKASIGGVGTGIALSNIVTDNLVGGNPAATFARVDGYAPRTESNAVTFSGLTNGQTLTIGGLTLTASGVIAAADVATAFANVANGTTPANPANGTFTGTLTGWSTGAATGAQVTFTSNTAVSVTNSYAPRTESNAVTFSGLTNGQTLTIGGLTLTASGVIAADDVATAFANVANGTTPANPANGTFTGTLTGWSTGAATGAQVTFTSNTAVSVTNGYAPRTESNIVEFSDLPAGKTLILGGVTLTAGGSAVGRGDIAAAFANVANGNTPVNPANGTFTGTLTGWRTGAATGSAVTFTSNSPNTNVADLANTGTGTVAITKTEGGGKTETGLVTFSNLVAGDSITVGGLTLTASGTISATNVAAAFANVTNGSKPVDLTNGTFTGTLIGWSTGAADGAQVTFTSSTGNTNIDNLITTTKINVTDLANTGTGTVAIAKTEGGGKNETGEVTFSNLVAGDSITVGGLTLTASGTISATNVAAAFANVTNGSKPVDLTNGTFTGKLDGWSSGARNGAQVIFTSATEFINVDNLITTTKINVTDLANTGTGTVAITKTEGGGKTETSIATFRDMVAGDSLTISGLTLTANGSITAADVATAFSNINNGGSGKAVNNGSWSGALSGWSTGNVDIAGTGVIFTSSISNTDIAPNLAVITNKVGANTLGATYNLKLSDGTNLSIKQISSNGIAQPQYKVEVDRFAMYATLDGVPLGQTSVGTGTSSIKINGVPATEQTSLGTMAFVSGRNIDSLSRDQFGKPQFITQVSIDASGGAGSTWGKTANGGTVQFTLDSTNMTGYSSAAQTYANSQDGSATSQLSAYSFDAFGKLVAQYDNGKSVTKGQLILATFNNFEGLIPVGGNGFQASSASGDPLIDKPNGSQMGAIRAQAIEESNVDLTQQLVKLMVLQRAYSAASQATKVQVATLVDDTLRIGQ